MFDLQSQFIFPTHSVALPGPLPAGAERVELNTPDGEMLRGSKAGGDGTFILSFAGNAWNSQEAANYLHQLFPQIEVLGFHYRGYRPSSGTPSSEALLSDGLLIHDFAAEQFRSKRIVAIGLSIGSGVAAYLAGKRALGGAVLVTPFDSLKAVASGHYPFLPIQAMFRHEMDSIAALRSSAVPVAIIAAEHDSLIIPQRTDALREEVGRLVYDETIGGAGHNDIYQRSAFHEAMQEAMAAVTR